MAELEGQGEHGEGNPLWRAGRETLGSSLGHRKCPEPYPHPVAR